MNGSEMIVKKCLRVFLALTLLGCAAGPVARAEETDDSSGGSSAYQQRRQELLKLKEQDPARFEQIVGEHRKHVREELLQLKEQDPQKFNEVIQRKQEHFRARMEDLRQNDPQQYEKIVQKRDTFIQSKLDRIQERNPERYASLIQNNGRIKDWADRRGGWHGEGMRGGRHGDAGGTADLSGAPLSLHEARRAERMSQWSGARQDGSGENTARQLTTGRNESGYRDTPPRFRGGSEENLNTRQEIRQDHVGTDGPNTGGTDRGNNPPGPRGGRGTDWENRSGPQGGPGTGPGRPQIQKMRRAEGQDQNDLSGGDADDGGVQNRPGPQGGPWAGGGGRPGGARRGPGGGQAR